MRSLHSLTQNLISWWNRARRHYPKTVVSVLVALAFTTLASLALSVWVIVGLRSGLPDIEALRRLGDMDQATTVFDGDDRLAFTIFKEQRIDVTLAEISPNLLKAIVAVEDQRFYDHHGVNLIRIGLAAVSNLRHGRVTQGGSTITQQLARLGFLTPDKTVSRKVQELILARRIESMFTKDQILELYLNRVYFGDGLYGVEAASRGYFGKHAGELSVAEAALLAGLVKSPSSYAPTARMERALARRNLVLQLMRDTHAIDQDTWKAARASKVELHDNLRAEESVGLYFKEQVRQELVSRFGWERVYQGGLRVFSTIDMAMQRYAETAVAEGLSAVEARRAAITAKRKSAAPKAAESEAPLQAALIAIDPVTGHVRAMVGGRNFDESHFNRAVQARRQPGSAFKPFVYAAALEAGYTPATVIRNLNVPIETLEGDWTPEDEHSSADSMSLRVGLRTSSNRAAVRLLQDVGIPSTVQYAKTMGVGDVPSVPSLALGSGDVTLQSMTAAYAAFANRGSVPRPLLIRRVEDRDGHVLYASEDTRTQAISETTAFLMANMLADVINAGTAARSRSLGFTLPAAGKTGTTNDFNDAWFVGFTPTVVAGVWVGFDQPHTILPRGFASDVAVPLWTNFMKAATKGDKPVWIPTPSGIVTAQVCRLSGKLAAEGCQHAHTTDSNGDIDPRSLVYTEYFARGTEPTSYCNLHATRGFIGAVVAAFTGGDKPDLVQVEEHRPVRTATAPMAVAAAPEPEAPPTVEETPKAKRGFWSRLLRIGKDRPANAKDRNR